MKVIESSKLARVGLLRMFQEKELFIVRWEVYVDVKYMK